MEHARPLPRYLAQRYYRWKATTHATNSALFKRLAEDGQHPREMIISCCDSRVHVTSIFGAESGEFFVHRNIANLVPNYDPSGDHHGTPAAVEYAVTRLKVSHLIVLGHSSCGGVGACYNMCAGKAPELEEPSSFIGRWMDILRPAYDMLDKSLSEAEQIPTFEKQAVLVSLENLMTFPFVRDAVEAGVLTLHGLWTDIGEGTLESYDPNTNSFIAI